MKLPESISRIIQDEKYEKDDIGMSDSSVMIFRDKVLKIQKLNKEAENEYGMLLYLQGMLPVPQVYAWEKENGTAYLLMEKCAGEMACSEKYMADPAGQCKLLAAGMKKMWDMDISDCTFDQSLSHKLAQAEINVKSGLVDLDNVEPETFGENGFKDPYDLLEWLCRNRPVEEPVMSHGDYCLPNLFGVGERVTGFIDLGRSGVGDKWCDIAICFRSLNHNYSGKYQKKYQEKYQKKANMVYDEMLLFRELGIKPDWEKIKYYILLDELF